MPAPDAAWWPIDWHKHPESTTLIRAGDRVLRVIRPVDGCPHYRIFAPSYMRIGRCDTLLELRALLLALAYPEGNTPTR